MYNEPRENWQAARSGLAASDDSGRRSLHLLEHAVVEP